MTSDSMIKEVVAELIAAQVHGQWPQQKAIKFHENGKIATNIRLDVSEADECSYINGYLVMHVKPNAKTLLHSETEYTELARPILITQKEVKHD